MMIMMRKSRQSGVSLMEVLVSVLVLSVGLLGVASMQGKSLRGTNGATTRTKAVAIAKDMVERIRSNNANAGAYDEISVDSGASAPTEPAGCPGTGCVIATYDVYRFNLAVRELPESSASISLNTTAGVSGEVTVTVTWQNPNDASAQEFVLRAAL